MIAAFIAVVVAGSLVAICFWIGVVLWADKDPTSGPSRLEMLDKLLPSARKGTKR